MIAKEDIFRMLWERPVEVGHWVGFRDLTDLHNGWLRSWLYGQDDQTLLCHRGSFKTSTLSLFFALHAFEKPNENLLYFRKTDTDVKEICKQTCKIIESGAMQEMARIVYGRPMVLTTRTDTELNSNLNTSIRGTSQIVGLGIGTSITGKHADIVVTDDIVNVKDRVSKAEREATKLRYQELINICNRGGRFINTGTPWAPDDAISKMPNVTRITCYETGLITPEKLAKIKEQMSPSLFAANYELRHIADMNALFTDADLTGDPEAIYDGLGHIDAAYGGGDSVAFTIMKQGLDGTITAYGKIWPEAHVQNCLPEILGLWEHYRCGTIFCEDNGDKGYLARDLDDLDIPASTYHESQNKHLKISTYLKKVWKQIKWIPETDPDYLLQITDYTEQAAHDDAPDSAASLVRQMKNQVTVNTGGYLAGGI